MNQAHLVDPSYYLKLQLNGGQQSTYHWTGLLTAIIPNPNPACLVKVGLSQSAESFAVLSAWDS